MRKPQGKKIKAGVKKKYVPKKIVAVNGKIWGATKENEKNLEVIWKKNHGKLQITNCELRVTGGI